MGLLGLIYISLDLIKKLLGLVYKLLGSILSLARYHQYRLSGSRLCYLLLAPRLEYTRFKNATTNSIVELMHSKSARRFPINSSSTYSRNPQSIYCTRLQAVVSNRETDRRWGGRVRQRGGLHDTRDGRRAYEFRVQQDVCTGCSGDFGSIKEWVKKPAERWEGEMVFELDIILHTQLCKQITFAV